MMQKLPHHYSAVAQAAPDGDVKLTSEGLDPLTSAPPREFGGRGDRWSPETLLIAAVSDCFVLSFRAIARASGLDWMTLNCEVEGTLDRNEGTTRFIEFRVRALLEIPAGTDRDRADRLLHKAEHSCLITNSLSGPTRLETTVLVAA